MVSSFLSLTVQLHRRRRGIVLNCQWQTRNRAFFRSPSAFSFLHTEDCYNNSGLVVLRHFAKIFLVCFSLGALKSENGFHPREIRPQGGFQLRNPNPDFLDFPFCRSIGKSEKGFAKLFSWTADYLVLIMRTHWRSPHSPLFTRTV